MQNTQQQYDPSRVDPASGARAQSRGAKPPVAPAHLRPSSVNAGMSPVQLGKPVLLPNAQ